MAIPHYVLDLIAALMRQHPESRSVRRPNGVEFVDPMNGQRLEIVIRSIDDQFCEHGIRDGEYCEGCSREYRRARIENGLDTAD